MKTQAVYTTFTCDLDKCDAEISTKLYWLTFLDRMREWGWRRALSTSPHPQPRGVMAWSINLFFCPEHAYLADHPEHYTIAPGKKNNSVANYTVVLVTNKDKAV